MGYDRGRTSKRNLAAAHPHHVTIKIPELGLGVITNAIEPKLREISGADHATWPQREGVDRHAVHGFKSVEHAAAFRAWIAEQWPQLLDLTPTPVPAPRPRTVRSH